MVEGGGFEPPKAIADRFTVCSLWPLGNPSTIQFSNGAGDGTRTRNRLITNQLLCQLSYASQLSDDLRRRETGNYTQGRFKSSQKANLFLLTRNFLIIPPALLHPYNKAGPPQNGTGRKIMHLDYTYATADASTASGRASRTGRTPSAASSCNFRQDISLSVSRRKNSLLKACPEQLTSKCP